MGTIDEVKAVIDGFGGGGGGLGGSTFQGRCRGILFGRQQGQRALMGEIPHILKGLGQRNDARFLLLAIMTN